MSAMALSYNYRLVGSVCLVVSVAMAATRAIGLSTPMLLIVAHGLWGLGLAMSSRRVAGWLFRLHEPLLALSLLLFLFFYLYANNANLDYVQRFIRTGGNLRLALDTATERLDAMGRFLPFVALDAGCYLLRRIGRRSAIGEWGLAVALGSGLLGTLALPSFASLSGYGMVGFVALVPLLLVLRRVSYGWGVFYGTIYGAFVTLLTHYWLATFNLLSLQFIVVLYGLFYALFFALMLAPLRRISAGAGSQRDGRSVRVAAWMRVAFVACAWTLFEYMRSIGFLGFPWGLMAHTQYANGALIQVAALTGVWGVSCVVLFCNAALAEGIGQALQSRWRLAASLSVGAVALPIALCVAGGIVLFGAESTDRDRSAPVLRVAAIQQNSDPRKHGYRYTLDRLMALSDRSLAGAPDLIIWPETAFVPNIRRWGQLAPEEHAYARLVATLLDWLATIETPLLTGNDDYLDIVDPATGAVERLNHNAAIYFSERGERLATYHKIRLVPFTEYFPYRETLPWLYRILQDFDATFWEPGSEYTLFHHPKAIFATPICFEDTFPAHVRRFVMAGAEVIVNISNDYWSLTPVEAKQHFAAALFRTVEHRRPMIRATTSGRTAHIDRYGRLQATRPYYSEEYLLADVAVAGGTTLYTRWGDWFPLLCGIGVAVGLSHRLFFECRVSWQA